MRFRAIVPALLAGVAAPVSAGPSVTPVDLGVATDDVWAYVSATDPAQNFVLSAWGSDNLDLNPEGFPGSPATRNFWSHVFVAWTLPADLPHTFGWGGATLTVTLASSTWQNTVGNPYLRFLDRGFQQDTWNILSDTPVPVPALGFILGDDSGATGADTTITFTLPSDLDPTIWRKWLRDGQIYVAITADTAPPPPPEPGQPPDLTGTLQIYSREDVFGRGATLTVLNNPRRVGDLDGNGVVNSQDLASLLGAWGSDDFFADVNGDGVVNSGDLAALLGDWG